MVKSRPWSEKQFLRIPGVPDADVHPRWQAIPGLCSARKWEGAGPRHDVIESFGEMRLAHSAMMRGRQNPERPVGRAFTGPESLEKSASAVQTRRAVIGTGNPPILPSPNRNRVGIHSVQGYDGQ